MNSKFRYGTQRNCQILGCAFAVLQVVLCSTMGILGKLLYAMGMDSHQVVISRLTRSGSPSRIICN